jgi:hypothetical protein
LLFLKLLLTPTLIATATLVQRRRGHAIGGWLVGLPLTSGPVCAFLLVEHGRVFAAVAARGTLAGTLSELAFCITYSLTSATSGWLPSLGTAMFAFLASTAVLRSIVLPLGVWMASVPFALFGALRMLQAREVSGAAPEPHARRSWDLPARAAVATAFVLALTALAPALGPTLSGLMSPLPIYAGVMLAFTHATHGARAVRVTVLGVITRLFAFAAFFAALAESLRCWPGVLAFLLAVVCALAVQAASGHAINRGVRVGGLNASSGSSR